MSDASPSPDEDDEVPRRVGAVVRRRKTNRRYDWDALRIQYIEGIDDNDDGDRERHWPTIRELADMHDLSSSRIGERASQERWNDRKSIYQNQLAGERRAARVKKLSGESIEFSEQTLNTAKLGIRITMGRLAEIGKDFAAHTARREELERAIRNNEIIGDLHDLRSPVYHLEMVNLAKAAETFQSIGLRALGEDIQRHEVSGPGGAPIEQTIDIQAEMMRDDPERLAKLMEAMIEARIPELLMGQDDGESDDGIIDAEEVEEGGETSG